jgi:beta-glucosidase
MSTLVAPAVAAQPPSRPATRERLESLLARMTLEEKVGQMTQLNVGVVAGRAGRRRGHRPRLGQAARGARHAARGLDHQRARRRAPRDGWHQVIRQIQGVATQETRLKIPVLYGIDFVHGANYTRGGTIFPHNVGMAATFDPALARRAGEVTRARGARLGAAVELRPGARRRAAAAVAALLRDVRRGPARRRAHGARGGARARSRAAGSPRR